MIEDLLWLELRLEARGRVEGAIHRWKVRMGSLASPYVVDEADGPIIAGSEDFRPGRS